MFLTRGPVGSVPSCRIGFTLSCQGSVSPQKGVFQEAPRGLRTGPNLVLANGDVAVVGPVDSVDRHIQWLSTLSTGHHRWVIRTYFHLTERSRFGNIFI